MGGMILTGETELLGKKTLPVPFCPQISHGLTWDQTRPLELTSKIIEKYS